MYCKHCGIKIDDDSRFCSFCGTKQSELSESKISLRNNQHLKEVAHTETTVLINSVEKNSNLDLNFDKIKVNDELQYDPNHERNSEVTSSGFLLLTVSIILLVLQPISFDTLESYQKFRLLMSIAVVAVRIFVTIWVTNIAKTLNRESTNWGIFAFFLPSIALIVIGQRKKIFLKPVIEKTLSNEENSIRLTDKGQKLLSEQKYNESIRFAEKAIELDSVNQSAIDLLNNARLQIPLNQVSNRHKQVVHRKTVDNKILKIISNEYKSIGAHVFIDEMIAPDGEYIYMNNDKTIIVKDGKIEKIKK